MSRDEMLKKLSQYRVVPGHGSNLNKLTDKQLELQLELYETMFETYFEDKKTNKAL